MAAFIMITSAQHQLECEARYYLRMTSEQRKEQYERIKKARGADALEVLKAEVKRQYEKTKENCM